MGNLLGFASLPWGLRALLLVICGGLAGFGQAPFDLWPVTVVALAGLFLMYRGFSGPTYAALHVLAFGIGYFGFSLRWIVEPFLVDAARHGWMAPFALALMATGGGLFWAAAAWCAARFAPRNIVVFGLALVAVEAIRSLALTGFPWALLGHIWVPTGMAQLAAFGGPHLLTVVTVVCAWAIALLAGRQRLTGLTVLGVLVAVSFAVRAGPLPQLRAELPVIRLVQPNAPQDQKWDPAFRDVFVNRLLRLSGEGDVPDLVVWPETAIPFLLSQIEDDKRLLSDAARGAPLVFGIQRRDAEWRAFNSLVVMGPGGLVQSIYDKQHLVPFGEYIPGGNLLGQFGIRGLAASNGAGFTPGTSSGPVDLPGIGLAVPLICYEGIFAEEIVYGDTRPRLLLLITNDAWFGQAAGPYQHLAQARLRAIEQGLPMVRVANTGVSAMIDAKGRVTASLPLGVDGALDAPLPPALPETLYARWGDLPVLGVLFLLMTGGYLVHRRDSD